MGAAHWTGSSHAAAPSTGAAGSQISQITVPTRDQIFSAFSDKSVLFNNDDDLDHPTSSLIPIYMMISIPTPIKKQSFSIFLIIYGVRIIELFWRKLFFMPLWWFCRMNECDSFGGFLGQEFPQTSWRPGTQAVPGYQFRVQMVLFKVANIVGLLPIVENHFVKPPPRRGIFHVHHKNHKKRL